MRWASLLEDLVVSRLQVRPVGDPAQQPSWSDPGRRGHGRGSDSEPGDLDPWTHRHIGDLHIGWRVDDEPDRLGE